jgi:hypothetical protein
VAARLVLVDRIHCWLFPPTTMNINRQSVASSRSSQMPGGSQPNPAALARLMEKKKEYEAICALERTSALFLRRIEGLAEDCDVMADAGAGA